MDAEVFVYPTGILHYIRPIYLLPYLISSPALELWDVYIDNCFDKLTPYIFMSIQKKYKKMFEL